MTNPENCQCYMKETVLIAEKKAAKASKQAKISQETSLF